MHFLKHMFLQGPPVFLPTQPNPGKTCTAGTADSDNAPGTPCSTVRYTHPWTRTPSCSTHGVFDFHFSSNIYFEVNPP